MIDSGVNWWMIGAIILLILMLGLVLYLMWQKKRARESEKEV
ncbi:hypothetical protein RV08_GL002520 [Enterococcus mundtii]|nr:hypothetical protein RV08_GL002520 [Enterococcus mundtii]